MDADLATVVQRRRVRIARLQEETTKTEARIRYLVEELLPRLRQELDEAVSAEEARSGEDAPIATEDGSAVPDAPTTVSREPLLSDAAVRDAAKRLGVFTEPELAAVLNVPLRAVKKALPGLLERRIVRATDRRFHGKPMYEYVVPISPGDAFLAQREETQNGDGRPGHFGRAAVPGTGKMHGASGKPGRDRAMARRGKRIKTKHGKA